MALEIDKKMRRPDRTVVLNRDQRSFILSMLIGDGTLSLTPKNGVFTIHHGLQQADYVSWKAALLSQCVGKEVRCRVGNNGASIQVQTTNRKFRAWRKIFYKNDTKDLPKILKFINNPMMALAIMLMDDGYVEPSISKLATGEKKNYGARFRFFCCDQKDIQLQMISEWFDSEFGVKTLVKRQRNNKTGKSHPFLKWGQEDSLKMWSEIRIFVLQFKSMKHKFRHIEQIYQLRCLQPPAAA